jgi:hypothetical protein
VSLVHILLARNYELIGWPQTAPDLDLSLDQISHLNPAPDTRCRMLS